MATSTGLILAAGAVTLGHELIVKDGDPARLVYLTGGTVGAAWAAAALDRIVPGFGTGTAVVLLLTVVLKYGPELAKQVFPAGATGGHARAGSGIVTV